MRPQDLGIGRLFERIQDAVIVAGARTQRIVLWNSAATNIFGYSASEAHELSVEFGTPRLRGVVSAHPGGTTLIDFLLAKLEQFTGEAWEQEDDITLLTLQRFRS